MPAISQQTYNSVIDIMNNDQTSHRAWPPYSLFRLFRQHRLLGTNSMSEYPRDRPVLVNANRTLCNKCDLIIRMWIYTHFFCTPGEVNSGSTVTVWIRARDILGNKKVDSTSVTYDLTEPQFTRMAFHENEISNIPFSSGWEKMTNCTTEYAVVFIFEDVVSPAVTVVLGSVLTQWNMIKYFIDAEIYFELQEMLIRGEL